MCHSWWIFIAKIRNDFGPKKTCLISGPMVQYEYRKYVTAHLFCLILSKCSQAFYYFPNATSEETDGYEAIAREDAA